MREIRLGTIGTGTIVRHILDNVARTEGIALEAVYSRSQENGQALAQAYGCEKVYTDLDAMLADVQVNTVYVASPNQTHYEQTKRALLAGKHVLCEKPFVPHVAQARELAELSRKQQRMLVEAAPTSFLPNYQALRAALGRIGRVRLVMGNYSQYSSRYDSLLSGKLPNVFNPAMAGGCLMDINFYNVYLNFALFGAPQRAVYEANCHPGAVDTSGVVTLTYPDFISVNIGAKDTWGVNYFQIEGEDGYIYIPGGSNGLAEIHVVTRAGEEHINRQSEPDRWYYEIQSLTPLLLQEDFEALQQRLDTTIAVCELIERMRRDAGILFPGDT